MDIVSNGGLFQPDLEVDPADLFTPLGSCLVVQPGPIEPAVLEALEKRSYDQAPVIASGLDRPLGLVTTAYLRQLLNSGEPLSQDDPIINDPLHTVIPKGVSTVDDVLSWLLDRPAVLVIRDYSSLGMGWRGGLLTISDLNEHGLRGPLYALLSSLELRLAELVRRHFEDPWDWLGSLSEENQVRILGFWELSRRRGVDVGALAAATLPQLLNIIARSKQILLKIGYKSRVEFESRTGHLPEIRNAVMHPVRPLILHRGDVRRVHSCVMTAKQMRMRVREVLYPSE